MHRVVFVYARSDSRRLPGKALLPLGRAGPLLGVVLARAHAVGAESCALLTSDRPIDNSLAELGANHGVQVVRGDATDLVQRSLKAITATGATHFLRVNGDSPLFSPLMARQAMAHLHRAALISNLFERRFPYGVAVEWMSADSYRALASCARDYEREHVTAHLYRTPTLLPCLSMRQARDDSELRLAVDTQADHDRLSALIGQASSVQSEYWDLCNLPPPDPDLTPLAC